MSKALCNQMKYVPIILIAASTAVTIFILSEIMIGFDWFFLWILFPFLCPLIVSVFQLTEKTKSQVIPISGAITSLAALPLYYEVYTYDGADGQIGLIFAVMPVYQIIGLFIFSVIGYIIKNVRHP